MGRFRCAGILVCLLAWSGTAAHGDEILLKDGKKVEGTLRLDGLLQREAEQDPERIDLSLVQEVHVRQGRVLFLLRDGGWVSARLLVRDLQIDRDGLWQFVHADAVEGIRLARTDPPRVVHLAAPGQAAAGALASPAAVPPPAPQPPAVAYPAVPSPVPPARAPAVQPPRPPAAVSEQLPDLDLPEGFQPVPVAAPAPEGEASSPVRGDRTRPFSVSLEGGLSVLPGSDGEVLGPGGGFGFSFSYTFWRKAPFSLAGEGSFLRTMHGAKGFLSGRTQNVNPVMFGVRGAYETQRHTFYAKVQTGALFLDASGGVAGLRNDTVWGFQYGGGYAYRFLPWLSAGPELRFTHGVDAGGISTWCDLLARVACHF